VFGVVYSSVRVYPSVQLHVALVTLGYQKCKWIPKRLRGLPLFAREPLRPKLYLTVVKSIGSRAYLKKNSVDAVFMMKVEPLY
jgi:hypothetical protein